MFVRILKESFRRQAKTKVLAVVTLTLGASVATALLNVSLDIGDRMTEELKQYGANIIVIPKERTLPLDIEGIDFNPIKDRSFIEEKYLSKLREIFWRYNIKGFAPHLTTTGEIDNRKFEVVGTWFEKENSLATGEVFVEGIKKTKPWLRVRGEWIDDENDYDVALLDEEIQRALSILPGETIDVTLQGLDGLKNVKLSVKGIVEGEGPQKGKICVPLRFLQDGLNMTGKVQEIEVSALTTPDNELSKKATEDPDSLSTEEFERWYCTAYVSSVASQIEEAVPNTSAKPIRKIAEAEGRILKKLKILMALLTALSLIGSAFGIWSLMTTAVLERTQEIGLMKAVGADSRRAVSAFMTEVVIISIFGSLLGWGAGLIFSQLIAGSVFGNGSSIKPIILPLVYFLTTGVAIMGSLSPIKIILRLKPIEVLHGRQ